MITLRSSDLAISVIDPTADAKLMGTRYCWGGYVWAVAQHDGTPLTTGPRWPDNPPPVVHGQGLPEVFRFWHKDDNHHLTIGADHSGVIIGVGSVQARDQHDHNPSLLAPATWHVHASDDQVRMTTADSAGGFAYALERGVRVSGSQLTIDTVVGNHGSEPVPLHWYAHPFLPPTIDGAPAVRVTGCTGASGHRAYPVDGTSLSLDPAAGWDDNGHFAWLDLASDITLNALVRTPTGATGMRCSHALSRMPIWTNQRTLSLEPYIETELAPGATRAWSVQYDFAASWTSAEA